VMMRVVEVVYGYGAKKKRSEVGFKLLGFFITER